MLKYLLYITMQEVFFLKHYSPEQKLLIPPEVMSRIASYSWPGNIRELRNFCERAAVLRDREIDQDVVKELLSDQAAPQQAAETPKIPRDLPAPQSEDDLLILLEALRQCGGNKTRAAERLGISRVTLWRRLRELGLP